MNVSTVSIFITVTLWYVLIGIYNIVYLGITKKLDSFDWKKFILETFGLVAVYFLLNSVSFQFGGNSRTVFIVSNILLILVCVFGYSRFVMKLEQKNSLVYTLVFTVIFNLYWYILFGLI